MPIVLRVRGYTFGFYASDRDERPHVHVRKSGKGAKYWLEPRVELAKNEGLRPHQCREVERLVNEHRDELLEAWHGFFGR